MVESFIHAKLLRRINQLRNKDIMNYRGDGICFFELLAR